MAKSILLAVIGMAALLVPAHARIGDTRAEANARYGGGQEVGPNAVLYTIDGYALTCTLNEPGPRITMELYAHCPVADGTRAPFKPEELDQLLEQEAGGHTWHRMAAASPSINWYRDDHQVYACFSEKEQVLTFISPENIPQPTAAPAVLRQAN